MLTLEEVKPELNSRIQLILIVRMQTHILLHTIAHVINNLAEYGCLLRRLLVENFEIVDERGYALDHEGLQVLD